MGSWDFDSIGFICNENADLVKRLLECMGIDFSKVHGSEDGEIYNKFQEINGKGTSDNEFTPEGIYYIANRLFENTTILFEHEEGNSVCDWYSRYEKIFNPRTNKVSLGKYDYCIGDEEDKEISKWKEDIGNIEIEEDKVNKIIRGAKDNGYDDIEKLVLCMKI